MKRYDWLCSLALALVSLRVATTLGSFTTEGAKLPEWVLYNIDNSRLPHGDGYIITFDAQGNAWRGTEGGRVARTDGVVFLSMLMETSGLVPVEPMTVTLPEAVWPCIAKGA